MRNIRHSIMIASATNGKMNTTKTTNQKLKVTSEEMFLLQQALMGERSTYLGLAERADFDGDVKAVKGHNEMAAKYSALLNKFTDDVMEIEA